MQKSQQSHPYGGGICVQFVEESIILIGFRQTPNGILVSVTKFFFGMILRRVNFPLPLRILGFSYYRSNNLILLKI